MSKRNITSIQTLEKKHNSNNNKRKFIHQKQKKRRILSLLLLGLIMIGFSITNFIIRLNYTEEIDGSAQWNSNNDQTYLEINAESSYELGYLTGYHLSSQILKLKLILIGMSSTMGISYDELKEYSNLYLEYIPKEHIEEMRGIANGVCASTGLIINFDDILIQNTFLDVFYGLIIPENLDTFGCTALAANNGDNSVEFGQNFDFNKIFKGTISWVKHRLENQNAIFSIRFGGCICLPLGKNEMNVSAMVTVVKSNCQGNIIIPTCSRSRVAFQSANSSSEFIEIFFEEFGWEQTCGFTMTILDENAFATIDLTPNNYSILFSDISIRTNTYINTTWQEYLVSPDYSKERQELAENLVNQNFEDNILNETEIIEILKKTPIICQNADLIMDIETIAFMTRNYFGLGNLKENSLGKIPF